MLCDVLWLWCGLLELGLLGFGMDLMYGMSRKGGEKFDIFLIFLDFC